MPLTSTQPPGKKFDALESGNFVLPQGAKQATITLADLAYTIQFDNDPKHTEPSVDDAPGANGKSLTLIFKGFTGVLPFAFQSQVGHVNGKPLWLVITISTIGDNIPTAHRLITYTFYTEA
ncbi:hypothetical protein MPLB_1120032 [Mesorhizobium sp. ORS 3324]|nr:hypothetical protein MPLB_1120032 [Mesorhizobium sp. ORS 3324]